jgi:hypothetical protein
MLGVSQTGAEYGFAKHFGGFFHQIKICQRIGRKNYIKKAACQRMRRLEAF